MRRILYTKYKKVDLNKVTTKTFQHLSTDKREIILDLINGTLGTRNITLVDLELKYDAKPVYFHPYPVPRVPESMLKKEVNN